VIEIKFEIFGIKGVTHLIDGKLFLNKTTFQIHILLMLFICLY